MRDMAVPLLLILGLLTDALLAPQLGRAAENHGQLQPDAIADGEWWLFGRNHEQQHFSPLKQINDHNATALGVAWMSDALGEGGLQGVPLVADGQVFVAGFRNTVYAVDVRSGKLVWSFAWPNSFSGKFWNAWGAQRHRGVALWKHEVLLGTADCHLVALAQKTGKVLWAVPSCDSNDNATITAAPRIGDGKVFIGMAGADSGARGHVDAFDAATGKHLWRFNTVPTRGDTDEIQQRAAATWSANIEPRGGAPYESIVYDPKTHLIYVGTGGPYPWQPSERGQHRGDELFTDCIVALNADTGAYVWHYQSTPDNAWNWESTSPAVVADLIINRRPRHVLMHAPKNGYFYVLDAQSGELISAQNFVPVSWASGIDPVTGRPIQTDSARYDGKPGAEVLVSPSVFGAHGMQPLSYSSHTGLVYFPAINQPGKFQSTNRESPVGGDVNYTWDMPGAVTLLAWDPIQQAIRWQDPSGTDIRTSGALTTAGNLVVYASNGTLHVLRADSGKVLHNIPIDRYYTYGTRRGSSAPITVLIDGVQEVLFIVDARVLAFKLGVRHPPSPPAAVKQELMPRPPLEPYPSELARRGAALFSSMDCELCHGNEASRDRKAAPDLRRSTALTHSMWTDIVIGGRYVPAGMPTFAGFVSAEDAHAIEAYVINEAWRAFGEENPTSLDDTIPAHQH